MRCDEDDFGLFLVSEQRNQRLGYAGEHLSRGAPADTRMTTLLQNQADRTTNRNKVIHRNTEQRESEVHIVSLQKDLDKYLHHGTRSLEEEEFFMIMDLRYELPLSEEIMMKS